MLERIRMYWRVWLEEITSLTIESQILGNDFIWTSLIIEMGHNIATYTCAHALENTAFYDMIYYYSFLYIHSYLFVALSKGNSEVCFFLISGAIVIIVVLAPCMGSNW